MRRTLVAVGLLLLLGTAWQPMVEGSPACEAPAAWNLFGPRSVYHTFAIMVSELQALQSVHPDMVKLESIGKTYEGRDIWAVKLSDDVSTNDTSEPDVLLFGGIHAREVMGVEVPMTVLNYMLDGYGNNETLTKYVNTKETWFVPMLNPDGHVFVEQGNDWRQNRRPTTGGYIGVDLNRNWGYMFGTDPSTSDNPAIETYHGPYAFSENETVAMRDLALRQRFATSLSFHSYSELILYPWGYTSAHCPDYNEFSAMGAVMAAWNGYTDQQGSDLYLTHGSSDDWLYGNVSTKAFTIELDTNFHPPDSQIDATCALNREPSLYIVGYPNVSIRDAGILTLVAPSNGSVVEPDRPLNVTARVMNYGSSEETIPVEMVISGGGYVFRNSTSIQLRAGQVGQVIMTWDPPMLGPDNLTIDVRTNLSADTSAWNDLRGGHFRIKAKYGATLNATGNTTAGCYPGENTTFSLNLTSMSNRDDDIIFEGGGYPLEWASLPAPVHLPPAGKASVELRVSVPRIAKPGEVANISVRAQSSTGQGSAGLVSTTTRVLDPAPVAVAGKDVTVNVTVEVAFDGTASHTPTGNLTSYKWDFGDHNSSEGAQVRHAYSRRGKYTVNLTVTNDRGWEGKASLNVTVDQSFRVELAMEGSTLKVLPGNVTSVNFTVKNAGNGPDAFSLSLDALKWNASLDLQDVVLEAGEERQARLTFTVPADSLAGATALFRVNAVSREYSYARADARLTATVAEVHLLNFSVAEPVKSSDAGGSPWFDAAIRNGGNIAENLTFTAAGVPEGWTVRFSRDNASVPAGATISLRITAAIPAGALAGDYSFTVNGLELTVSVNERRGLEVSADVQTAELRAGGTAVFNLTLKNIGNAPASFNVSATGIPAGWTAGTLTPLTLQPGANAILSIGITVAANARPGSYDMTLLAQASADPNITRSIPVQVKVLRTEKKTGAASFELSGMMLPALLLLMILVAAAGAFAYSRRKKRMEAAAAAPEVQAGNEPRTPPLAAQAVPTMGIAAAPEATATRQGVMPAAAEAAALEYGVPPAAAEAAALEYGVPPVAEGPASEQTLCLWCFKKVREDEILRQCPGCGAMLHADCAASTGTCPRCGGQV
jgi:hypothetical protein